MDERAQHLDAAFRGNGPHLLSGDEADGRVTLPERDGLDALVQQRGARRRCREIRVFCVWGGLVRIEHRDAQSLRAEVRGDRLARLVGGDPVQLSPVGAGEYDGLESLARVALREFCEQGLGSLDEKVLKRLLAVPDLAHPARQVDVRHRTGDVPCFYMGFCRDVQNVRGSRPHWRALSAWSRGMPDIPRNAAGSLNLPAGNPEKGPSPLRRARRSSDG